MIRRLRRRWQDRWERFGDAIHQDIPEESVRAEVLRLLHGEDDSCRDEECFDGDDSTYGKHTTWLE